MNVAVTNILKRIAIIVSVFAIAWCLIDPVYADAVGSYTLLSAGCYHFGQNTGNDLYRSISIDSDVRAIALIDSNDFARIFFFKDSSFLRNSSSQSGSYGSCGVPSSNALAYTGVSGYYYYIVGTLKNYDLNGIISYQDTFSSDTERVSFAYSVTYGDDVVDPVEPISYGLLDDVGFTTDIAGTGNASTSNVDTISWNPVYDSNGNNIMGASVSIRAVPGHYSADSKQNLFEKLRSDFVLDMTDLAVLDSVNIEEGSFSISWGQVISAFSLPFGNFISWFKTDEVFLKQGWIYQIQFTKGDYTSEWQTVYTIQSESPADSLHVINSTAIDQETINILQQINTINNSTNIWIIDETPVDPNDNYTPPSSDDEKPWWAYLLEMINNSIGITNKYINDGTDESQQVVNNIETNNNDLDVTVNEYHDIENDLVTDMNDKVTDLDIEEELTSDASFLSSARWVTEQFNTIVSNNPIGMILKFSLVLGFVTIFLGRFR